MTSKQSKVNQPWLMSDITEAIDSLFEETFPSKPEIKEEAKPFERKAKTPRPEPKVVVEQVVQPVVTQQPRNYVEELASSMSKVSKRTNKAAGQEKLTEEQVTLNGFQIQLDGLKRSIRENTMVSGIGQGGDGQTPGSGEVKLARMDDVDTTDLALGDALIWNGNKFVPGQAGGGGAVDSVNGEIGVVVLDADDISDTSTTNKFVTAAQITSIGTAVQPGDLDDVATSGNYDDLSNKPTLGTAAAQDVEAFATAAQGSKADTAVQPAALADKADLVDGKVPTSQIPPAALSNFRGHVASEAEMIALSTAVAGDWCYRDDLDAPYILTDDPFSVAANWKPIASSGGAVDSVNGQTGTVILGAADVGAATATQGGKADTAVQPNQLGTAALLDASSFATDEQGDKADSAVQPGDLGTAAAADTDDFATAAQGAKADSALQSADISGLATKSELTTATSSLPYRLETDKTTKAGETKIAHGDDQTATASAGGEIQLVDNLGFFHNVTFSGTGGVTTSSTAAGIVVDGSALMPKDFLSLPELQ